MKINKSLFNRIALHIVSLLIITLCFGYTAFAGDDSDSVTKLPDSKYSLTV